MKTKFYSIKDGIVSFEGTEKTFDLSTIEKMDVVIIPVKKSKANEFLNATANFLAASIANGDEKVFVAIKIYLTDNTSATVLVENSVFVRNNLDYHDAVKQARLCKETILNAKNIQ